MSYTCTLNGKVVTREKLLEQKKGIDFDGGRVNTQSSAGWPIVSDAMGVLPMQIAEAKKLDTKLGVSADYTKEGQPIFRSQGHRKKFCEAHGVYDLNGGYGDPQRR